jgi:group II intron reverse transcriptase/maturase
MQTRLQGIANKAKLNNNYRFRDLFRMIDEEALIGAWKLLNKRAAAGNDKITAREYEENLEENIERIVENLKKKRYRAKMVRRTYIPKGKGKMRPLGIPAIEDKLLQIVVAQILNAIYEQDFIPNSFGYRKGRNPHQAIKQISEELQYGMYNYIVEADIKGFFDNMNHDWIVKMLEQRIDDRAFIWLIKKWLKAGVVEEDGKVIHPVTGSPQGGIVSPVIANIYLHYALDLWFEKKIKPTGRGEAYLCRYADDFICAFRFKVDAENFYRTLGTRLKKFDLELSKEKTNIIQFSRYRIGQNRRFDFLGFEFRWAISRTKKRIIKKRTTPKKMEKSINKFTQWCRTIYSMKRKEIFKKLDSKLRGYYNYYGLIGNYKSLAKFFYRINKILFKWLKKKSYKKRLNWDKFNRWTEIYGVCKPRIKYERYEQQDFSFV